ncbi:MAG: cysteine--tRNA ligase, partial [Chloroflexi bacterium]|nr:cysteine--tRNA ligase [Chloroflexota bacterium]
MKVYNSQSQSKEDFLPSDPVKMYVCGVTTYSDCHIGHAMSYIVFDTIRRYLEYRGYSVKHVQNFTDIDDKIIANANRLNVPAKELADGLIDNFFADMDALNIQHAHIYPKVTEEISDIINLVKGLIDKGYAYQSEGDVYFRVNSFTGYGKLSHRSLDEMVTGDQGQHLDNKEHPMDFALWKSAKPGDPEWDSPWGKGRPGWHIECSSMSLKYLGETLDIHGGGQDLVFPHHENEIAQSEAYTGKAPFAKYWMHNGLLQFEKEKMSKSTGNLITIKEALSLFSSDALRLFVLSSHYRSPITYTKDNVVAMSRGVQRLRQAAFSESNATESDNIVDGEPFKNRFIEAMDDDFNTAQAVAALFDLAKEINKGQKAKMQVSKAQKMLTEFAGVLGLTLKEEESISLDAIPLIELLIETRKGLRTAKQWELADNVRNGLLALGITLE